MEVSKSSRIRLSILQQSATTEEPRHDGPDHQQSSPWRPMSGQEEVDNLVIHVASSTHDIGTVFLGRVEWVHQIVQLTVWCA